MLIPSAAVTTAVTATKITDLISGPAMPALMRPSPDHHGRATEQRRGEQAAPRGQRGRRTAEGQSRELPDELALRERACHVDGRRRSGGWRAGGRVPCRRVP